MKATRLTVEGVGPDEIPTAFLVAVMEAAEEAELDVYGVSIDRMGSSGGSDDDRE